MSSSSRSRRRLLAAASGCLGVALAGCTANGRPGSSSSGTEHETAVDAGGRRSSTHEYEVRFARYADDDPFVFRDEETARKVEQTPEDEPLPIGARSILFVTDEAAAEDLHVEADEGDREAIQTFVDGTDFERETVALDQRSIGDCYRREVRGVEARDDDFMVHYCRRLKDPTTPCEADRDVMEAVVCRVDRSYEEAPSSRGGSESMACRYRADSREERGAASNASDATGDGGDRE